MARTTGTASLADLLEQGVLHRGEVIVVRRRSAPEIGATIGATGTIVLDGRVFQTPTAAAKHALGTGSVDGWVRWRVPRLGGRSLDELRGAR